MLPPFGHPSIPSRPTPSGFIIHPYQTYGPALVTRPPNDRMVWKYHADLPVAPSPQQALYLHTFITTGSRARNQPPYQNRTKFVFLPPLAERYPMLRHPPLPPPTIALPVHRTALTPPAYQDPRNSHNASELLSSFLSSPDLQGIPDGRCSSDSHFRGPELFLTQTEPGGRLLNGSSGDGDYGWFQERGSAGSSRMSSREVSRQGSREVSTEFRGDQPREGLGYMGRDSNTRQAGIPAYARTASEQKACDNLGRKPLRASSLPEAFGADSRNNTPGSTSEDRNGVCHTPSGTIGVGANIICRLARGSSSVSSVRSSAATRPVSTANRSADNTATIIGGTNGPTNMTTAADQAHTDDFSSRLLSRVTAQSRSDYRRGDGSTVICVNGLDDTPASGVATRLPHPFTWTRTGSTVVTRPLLQGVSFFSPVQSANSENVTLSEGLTATPTFSNHQQGQAANSLPTPYDSVMPVIPPERAVQRGLNIAMIQSLPEQEFVHRPDISDQHLMECQICQSEYARADMLRRLPCWHSFHTRCIDRWLQKKRTCPVCRCDVKRALRYTPPLSSVSNPFESEQSQPQDAEEVEPDERDGVSFEVSLSSSLSSSFGIQEFTLASSRVTDEVHAEHSTSDQNSPNQAGHVVPRDSEETGYESPNLGNIRLCDSSIDICSADCSPVVGVLPVLQYCALAPVPPNSPYCTL